MKQTKYIAVGEVAAHEYVLFVQIMGGTICSIEKHEHFDYDSYTIIASSGEDNASTSDTN